MHTPAPNRLYLRGGWIAIALAVLVWTSTFFLLYLPGNRELGQIGPLGDWVAGLTAPFLSIAGFFMIYAAFRQQSAGTATARQEFLLQRFETVFFQLVQLYHQNAQTIQDSYGKQVQEDFFEAAHRFLKKHLNQRGDLDSLQRIYASFYEQHYNRIDHFVRHLLFCIHFVHHSNAFDSLGDQEAHTERDHYLRILQAQLSTEELVLLFYHSLCDPTGYTEGFRPLLMRYQFFGRLTLSTLLVESHWAAYCELPERKENTPPQDHLIFPPGAAHADVQAPRSDAVGTA